MRELKDKDEQYNQFLKYANNQKKNNSDFGKTFWSTVITVLFAFLIAVFIYDSFMQNPGVNTEGAKLSFLDKLFSSNKKSFNVPFFNRRQNILVLGVDSNGSDADAFKGTRSDTILLVNVDPLTRSINAISIPRDSKVYLADNNGVQKINHAHALGGVNLTKKTIEETLGVKIDRYVVINTKGVRELVDAIGGVPVYVEKPLRYDDYSGGLHIHLSKGVHVLDGVQAEGFLRFRHDGLGDIGRTSRQQWFLRALMQKLQTPQTITKIPDALKIATKYVQTDMSLYEMSHLAALTRNVDIDSIEVATLPGGPSSRGYISYWILDPEKTQEVINRLIYREKVAPKGKLTVGIMYSVSKENEAMQVKDELEEFGYEVNCVGRGKVPHSQIIAYKQEVTNEFISRLKRKIPEIRRMQFVYDPNKMYCVQSDFTIILSDN